MSEFAIVIAQLIAGTAVVAGLCNLVTRNTLVSSGVAIVVTFALLYWVSLRHDALWPLAMLVIVPVVFTTTFAVAVLAYGIRTAFGKDDDEA